MRESIHNLLSIKSYNTYFFTLCFCMLITLFGCSNTDENTNNDNKLENYEFVNTNNNAIVNISLQHTNNHTQLHIINTIDKKSMLSNNSVKIFAFFPNDCNMCIPTLIHINNLLYRSKNLQVFILSKQTLNSNGYKDFPITLSYNLIELVDKNNKLDLFIDSLKRALNIEIRDYKAPLFILQDTKNNITQSIEGAVLEEIFEQTVAELLNRDSKTDSNITQKKPNNTLSKTSPSNTETLKNKN